MCLFWYYRRFAHNPFAHSYVDKTFRHFPSCISTKYTVRRRHGIFDFFRNFVLNFLEGFSFLMQQRAQLFCYWKTTHVYMRAYGAINSIERDVRARRLDFWNIIISLLDVSVPVDSTCRSVTEGQASYRCPHGFPKYLLAQCCFVRSFSVCIFYMRLVLRLRKTMWIINFFLLICVLAHESYAQNLRIVGHFDGNRSFQYLQLSMIC